MKEDLHAETYIRCPNGIISFILTYGDTDYEVYSRRIISTVIQSTTFYDLLSMDYFVIIGVIGVYDSSCFFGWTKYW